MSIIENKNTIFPGVKDGETFNLAGIEFIKFPSVDGMTPRGDPGYSLYLPVR